MPNVGDIVNMAESLEKSRIAVLKDNCVKVRNRNAQCRKCIDVCPYDCISIQANEIKLSPTNCVNCGLCTVVCPTEALRPLDPTNVEIKALLDDAIQADDSRRGAGQGYDASEDDGRDAPNEGHDARDGGQDVSSEGQVASSGEQAASSEGQVASSGEQAASSGGRAVIACARISSKHLADPSLYVEVPCLGRVSESMLVDAFARGASKVLLVDGNCETCKHKFTDAYTEIAVQTANVLLMAQGSELRVERASEFPEDMLIDDDSGVFGSSRRTFFSDTVKSARDIAVNAADAAIKQELGIRDSEPDIGERLRVSENGALPAVSVPRHNALLNAMDVVGSPVYESVDTRQFGSVQIDAVKCNACGMCAVFCPTGAIRRDPMRETPTSQIELLEFSAADCVQCGLCIDVCWKKCLTVGSEVKLDDIFDFEPRVFNLVEAKRVR